MKSFLQSVLPRYVSFRKMSKIAVCQMQATNNVDSNLQSVENLVKRSSESGAKFIFLPECCDFVGNNKAETLNLSESLDRIVKKYCELAQEHKVWLSLGGLHEKILDQPKIFNCHFVINDQGEIVAKYRKLHLFDVDTPEFKFRESEVVKGGQNLVAPLQTPIGALGLQICYDMRFPEASILLRKSGAQILTYPSAFAYTTGIAHWEVLLRSRAIENQCYVIAAAQIGYHNKKRRSYGHAMVVDPWGKILAETKEDEPESFVIADINLDKVEEVRRNMPCFNHRCDSVYNLNCLSMETGEKEIDSFDFGGHEIPRSTVFHESTHCYAFTNIRCVVPGHSLVATKRVAKRLSDLTEPESIDFFSTVMKVQRMLEKVHEATSLTVTVQDGADAGQTVQHVHCHVMPRHKNDFINNDEIYTALNKHDKDNNPEERRSLEDMAKEAAQYREAMKEI